MIILVHVTWYTCAWVKFLGCGVCTCSVLLGDAKRYSKMGVKSSDLLPPAVYSDVHYSVSLFHILPILSDFKIFAHQVGVNGILLWFHYAFFWLLMNISLYVMGIYLASSMKCLFISFAHELFVPSWVYLFLIDIDLYFGDINPFIADTFPQFVSCLFTIFCLFDFGVFW